MATASRALTLAGIATVMIALAVPAAARTAPQSFADLAQRLLPSVVNISTTQIVKPSSGPQQSPPQQGAPGSPFEDFFREFFDRRQERGTPRRNATSLGSGFVIDPKGLIVTNNHVIAEADEITVTFSDDRKLKAKVVGRDAKTDLAVLKVEPKKPLPSLKFGDSDRARVGDWVVAIGNPFGLGGTVTAGIVSARHRDINSGPYDDFIQTDASINRGNSGGPMFNLAGEVVGINTTIFSPTGGSVGIGFAIPAKLAKPIIDQLIEFGRARRGWLGVRIQTVTDEIAQGLGLPKASGALVASLSEGGPAKKANIAVGDVILTFNGKPITEMRSLPRIVAETPVGKTVNVVVWRKGAKKTLRVNLGEFPDEPQQIAARTPSQPRAATAVETLGLKLATITPALRQRFNLDDNVSGVVVTEVEAGSAAAEKQIRPGDVIRKIGPEQSKVSRPNQVKKQVDKARGASMSTVLVLVERDGNQRFVAIKLAKG